MNHEMRTPKHVNIALLSLLQETELIPEQQLIVVVASKGLFLSIPMFSELG